MGKGSTGTNQSGKIIPLVLDAQFYYQKAVQAMNKKNYANALRYFRRTVELEPDNPVNHCNLAGVLAEIGRFEESNHILHHVLEHLAPDFHECNLFLGHNYASLGEFSTSRKYALRYIQKEPNGEYVADAEELLEYLDEVDGEGTEEPVGSFLPPEVKEHEEVIRILERGKFLAALRKLKRLVEVYPHFLPARNNLSLAYFYLGQVRAAIEEVYHVLEIDPGNLHALCNLAVFTVNQEVSRKILEGLENVYPIRIEDAYKLATTFGLLEKDAESYRKFLHIYRLEGETPILLHFLAISAYNAKEDRLARYWWKRLKKMEEGREIANYFLSKLDEGGVRVRLNYRYPPNIQAYDLSRDFHEVPSISERIASQLSRLESGNLWINMEVIAELERLGGVEVEETFRQMLINPEEQMDVKGFALMALVRMNAALPIRLEWEGEFFYFERYPNILGIFLRFDIIRRVKHLLQERGITFSKGEQERLNQWFHSLFFMNSEPLFTIRKWSGLTAAVEYWVRHQEESVKKGELAKRYNISLTTLNRYLQLFFEY